MIHSPSLPLRLAQRSSFMMIIISHQHNLFVLSGGIWWSISCRFPLNFIYEFVQMIFTHECISFHAIASSWFLIFPWILMVSRYRERGEVYKNISAYIWSESRCSDWNRRPQTTKTSSNSSLIPVCILSCVRSPVTIWLVLIRIMTPGPRWLM